MYLTPKPQLKVVIKNENYVIIYPKLFDFFSWTEDILKNVGQYNES